MTLRCWRGWPERVMGSAAFQFGPWVESGRRYGVDRRKEVSGKVVCFRKRYPTLRDKTARGWGTRLSRCRIRPGLGAKESGWIPAGGKGGCSRRGC